MRKYLWMAGLTLGLAWTGSANAQFSNNMISVMPNITNNAPMSYRNPNAPIGGTIYRKVGGQLNNYFYSPSRTNFISSTVNNGQSIFPTPAQMQATAPFYFMPFQMHRAGFLTP